MAGRPRWDCHRTTVGSVFLSRSHPWSSKHRRLFTRCRRVTGGIHDSSFVLVRVRYPMFLSIDLIWKRRIYDAEASGWGHQQRVSSVLLYYVCKILRASYLSAGNVSDYYSMRFAFVGSSMVPPRLAYRVGAGAGLGVGGRPVLLSPYGYVTTQCHPPTCPPPTTAHNITNNTSYAVPLLSLDLDR